MLYIYIALFLSSILCLTGLILSVINLEKYNFGLYIALVAIVGFTVALAFFVVKPRLCLRPRWFLKLFGQNLPHNRFGPGVRFSGPDAVASTEAAAAGGRRLMFFGFNTAAFLQSELEAGYTTRGAESRTVTQTAKLLELATPGRYHPGPTLGQVHFGLEDEHNPPSRVMDDPPSTTLIPPTPPSLDAQDEEATTGPDTAASPDSATRVRAWTFTCAATNTGRECCENRKRGDSSIECAREWQKVFLRGNRNLLLQSSFPLSERMPSASILYKHRTGESSPASNVQSWSTEEVVNLDEFLSNEKVKSKISTSSSESPLSDRAKPPPPLRKNALSPNDGPHSWRRAHTITVKYVPVKEEWIPKPLMGGLYRKKSRSTNAMFTILNGKGGDGSPWWSSVTSLFQRGTMVQMRTDSCHRL